MRRASGQSFYLGAARCVEVGAWPGRKIGFSESRLGAVGCPLAADSQARLQVVDACSECQLQIVLQARRPEEQNRSTQTSRISKPMAGLTLCQSTNAPNSEQETCTLPV